MEVEKGMELIAIFNLSSIVQKPIFQGTSTKNFNVPHRSHNSRCKILIFTTTTYAFSPKNLAFLQTATGRISIMLF